MIHIAKQDEHLWVDSMGKKFRVLAISDTVEEANRYMERNDRAALIACFGPWNIMANKYEGEKETPRYAVTENTGKGGLRLPFFVKDTVENKIVARCASRIQADNRAEALNNPTADYSTER